VTGAATGLPPRAAPPPRDRADDGRADRERADDRRADRERTGHEMRARLVVVALGLGLAVAVAPYAPGLLGAGILYVVCAPAHRRLAPRLGAPAAALLLVAAAVVLLLLPAIWLTVLTLEQAPGALRRVLESDTFALLATLRVGAVDVGAQLARAGSALVAWASGQAIALVGSATRALLNLLLALVSLYYLLQSADALWRRVRPLIPFSAAGAEELRRRFWSVTEATLLGLTATALAQGTAVGLGFWAVGLPNPMVWGMATALVSVLPVLGSSLVWGPGVLVLLGLGRPGAAPALAAIGALVVSNVDNVVRPIVLRRHSGVHPVATLLGAFAGVELVGLPGLLLGPLAISYFFALLHLVAEEYGHERDAPAPIA
jgi:predicted PurR-regulated permease PerM